MQGIQCLLLMGIDESEKSLRKKNMKRQLTEDRGGSETGEKEGACLASAMIGRLDEIKSVC